MHRKSTLRVLGAVAVLALLAAGCSSNDNGGSSSSSKKTVKLAFFGALPGSAAGLVVPGWQAVQLAVANANAGKYGNRP